MSEKHQGGKFTRGLQRPRLIELAGAVFFVMPIKTTKFSEAYVEAKQDDHIKGI